MKPATAFESSSPAQQGGVEMMGRAVFLMACTLLLVLGLVGADDQTGADFLKIPIGARGLGMARSFTALADGTDALNCNPAGMVGSRELGGMFGVSHQILFEGNSLDQAGFTFPVRRAAMGFNVLRLSYGDIDGRGADRVQTGDIGASDVSLGLGFAYPFKRVRAGAQIKVIQQRLGPETATGAAVDAGFIMGTSIKNLTLGGSVRNWGGRMSFIDEKYHLPLELSLGGAYHTMPGLAVTGEIRSQPYDRRWTAGLGTELRASSQVMLRAGYLSAISRVVNTNELGGIKPFEMAGLTGGLGVRLGGFSLDYALQPFGEVGPMQTFTVGSRLGGSPQKSAVPDAFAMEQKAENNRIILRLDLSSKPFGLPAK